MQGSKANVDETQGSEVIGSLLGTVAVERET